MPLRPTFSVKVGSVTSTDDRPVLGPMAIVVDRALGVPGDALEVTLADAGDIAIGDSVTLDLGHDGARERVFTGSVVEIRTGLAGARVRAMGTLGALFAMRVAVTYEQQSAGAVVRDLVSQAGLDAGTIDDGPTLPAFAVSRRAPAGAFVQALARRLGYELYSDREGRVAFRALAGSGGGPLRTAESALTGGAVEIYEKGKHLLKANAFRRGPSFSRVEVGGESPMSRQGDDSVHMLTPKDDDNSGDAGSGDATLLVLDPVARTRDIASTFANGYLTSAGAGVDAIVMRTFGRPSLELGDSIEIQHADAASLNRKGRVRSVRHRYTGASGFVTEITFQPEPGS